LRGLSRMRRAPNFMQAGFIVAKDCGAR